MTSNLFSIAINDPLVGNVGNLVNANWYTRNWDGGS